MFDILQKMEIGIICAICFDFLKLTNSFRTVIKNIGGPLWLENEIRR